MRVKSPVFHAKAGDFFRTLLLGQNHARPLVWAGEVSMRSSVFFVFSLLLSFLIPFPLSAQEEVTLEEVVVTGTRDVEEIRKIPANVTVVTQDQIQQSNARTTVDLLRDQKDVVVRDFYGNGKTASVDLRGFGETAPLNVLVLVDGRRVNAIDLSGVDWTQIPLDQVERIEIVRGAGSVLYGDNAVGGVINIITKKPEKPFSAQVEGVWGSYGYNRESGSVSGKSGPFSALLNAAYSGTEGYRDNGFLRTKDLGGNVTYSPNENFALSLSGSLHSDDAGLPGGLPRALYETDRRATLRPDDQAKTDDGYGALGLKTNFGAWGRLEANLSYQHRNVKDDFRSYAFQDDRDLTVWGFTPRYILEKPLWGHGNKLIAGADYYHAESDVDSESVFMGTTFSNRLEVTKKSLGLYFLDEFSVLDNLLLTLGYRQEWVSYDLFQASPRAQEEEKDHEPAYNASLSYLFGKRSSAFLSFRRSFRFPVSDELIQFFPSFRVNPNIKPQTGYDYEAGVRHAFTENIEANLTLFWIDLDNEIFFNPETFTNENYPKTRRQGVEIGARVRPFPLLSLWGNYTYVKAVLKGGGPFSGNEIPGVPKSKGSVGVSLDLGKGFQFNTAVTAVGSRYFISDFANRLDPLDAYYTLDAKLTFAWKGLKAFVGVNNLTNQKFAEWGVTNASGTTELLYASPTRNFLGGISYNF